MRKPGVVGVAILLAGIATFSASHAATAIPNVKKFAKGATSEGPGHYVSLRGIRIYYEDRGKGAPLLLLHGGTGNCDQFSKQVPAFVAHYRLILPDSRAQGRTSDGPGPLSYHLMAEDVLALMDHLGIRSARVMGWSDGGVIGLDLAAHHPERVSHLVTFGANTRADGVTPDDAAWTDTATWTAMGEGTRKAYVERAPDSTRFAEAMTKIIALWRSDAQLPPAILHRIRAKTLICAGDHDLIRREHTEEIAKAIPGAQVWIVPDANHSVMIDKPEVVNPRVLEFFAR